MTKYTLTDEHRARFPEWRDKWIANALRTGPYTEADKTRCRAAMDGLYRAADLTPPPRGVFCASPISAAVSRIPCSVRNNSRLTKPSVRRWVGGTS